MQNQFDLADDSGQLVAAHTTQPTLADLLAGSDYTQQPAGELEWVNAPSVGDELI
jgi:hypothetical protein